MAGARDFMAAVDLAVTLDSAATADSVVTRDFGVEMVSVVTRDFAAVTDGAAAEIGVAEGMAGAAVVTDGVEAVAGMDAISIFGMADSHSTQAPISFSLLVISQ
jgi:hypothetical protein